jgi:hypothetical protein
MEGDFNGSNDSIKKTLTGMWESNRVLSAVILVLVVLGLMSIVGLFGYGMFKALKGSEYMDATGVPSDANSWRSRNAGGSDRLSGTEFSQPTQGSAQNLSLTSTEVSSRDPLTVTRGNGPDFWEISSMLGDYQSSAGKSTSSLYWSPDLSAWVTEEEAMSLSQDVRNRLQLVQGAAPAAAQAKAEYMRANQNALLTEQFRENSNALLSPEERMLSENFALLPEVREHALLSADKLLYQRSGVY